MTRTYLFVRAWVGFSQTFDAHQFDDVGNDELCGALTNMSAAWAEANPDKVRMDPPISGQDLSEAAGWTVRSDKPDRRHATAPMWEVFHVENDEEIARDVLRSLRSYEHHFRFGPITLGAFSATDFQRSELIDFERQIEWLDDEATDYSWAAVKSGNAWERPRHILRTEGVARGQSLRRLILAAAKQEIHAESLAPSVVAAPRVPGGPRKTRRPLPVEDQREFKPASFFPKKMHARMRHAAGADRKTKRVETRTEDGVVFYCVDDARKWWPNDCPKPERT